MPFGRTFLGTILNQKSEKRHPKRHPTIDTEKTQKNMPKGFQNYAKMETQICDCSCFLEEGESWKTVGFSNRKRGWDHVERFQDWLRIYAKTMPEWDMEKEHRKDGKMVPKWEPKSHTKWEMEWKRHATKIMPKLGAQKGEQKRAKGKRKWRVEKVRSGPTPGHAGRSGRRLTCP